MSQILIFEFNNLKYQEILFCFLSLMDETGLSDKTHSDLSREQTNTTESWCNFDEKFN